MTRLIVDSLIAMMLVAILAAVLWHYRSEQRLMKDYHFIHTVLDQLHDQTLYHKALGDVKLNAEGFPTQISPKWFGDQLPVNIMVPLSHPWMDIAPPNDQNTNPPDAIITSSKQAGLWYNPNNGIFRARVAPQISDEATLKMYNRVNGTALAALPNANEPLGSRAPLAWKFTSKTPNGAPTPTAAVRNAQHHTPQPRTRPTLVRPETKPRPTLVGKPAP